MSLCLGWTSGALSNRMCFHSSSPLPSRNTSSANCPSLNNLIRPSPRCGGTSAATGRRDHRPVHDNVILVKVFHFCATRGSKSCGFQRYFLSSRARWRGDRELIAQTEVQLRHNADVTWTFPRTLSASCTGEVAGSIGAW